jgi:hypothetical protein
MNNICGGISNLISKIADELDGGTVNFMVKIDIGLIIGDNIRVNIYNRIFLDTSIEIFQENTDAKKEILKRIQQKK